MTGPRVAALIPCLDVEETIVEVVRGALERVDHVLVVDDGSRDRTAALAASAGADVLRQGRNRGKGAALRAGLQRLRAGGHTHAFSVDGDGQHLAAEMPALLEEVRRSPEALVLGVRRRSPDQEVAGLRRFGNGFADWWVAFAAGRPFPDTQSGFRVYPIDATLALGARGDHYEFESEILILAGRRGMPVRSREIRVYYPAPADLVSHYRPWIDTIRIIRMVVPFVGGWRR